MAMLVSDWQTRILHPEFRQGAKTRPTSYVARPGVKGTNWGMLVMGIHGKSEGLGRFARFTGS
jgi:hypothetical protein